jgi:hypothetical protein
MSAETRDVEALDHTLAVILARVRCEAIHQQTNNGRCVSCISWAKRIGVPRHRQELARHDAEVEARVREQIAQAIECTDLLRDDDYGDGIRVGLSMSARIARERGAR